MEDDQKFKMLMAGTVILFLVIIVYVGAGTTGLTALGVGDENTLSINDYNVLLNECQENAINLLENNITQSKTITNVNDLLTQSQNQLGTFEIDLNTCNDDINAGIQKWQDLNNSIGDLNTARQICKNNLINAINLKIVCEGKANDCNTDLQNANDDKDELTEDLDDCEDIIDQKDGDIGNLTQLLNTANDTIDTQTGTISTLTLDINSLETTNTELILNLNTAGNSLCDLNTTYCCGDANTTWAWC